MPISRLLLICSFIIKAAYGQQMVSNGSFENYSSLPTGFGQVTRAAGWNNCSGGGTPEYYNTAGSVPTYFGTNLPHTGNGMAGFIPYHGPTANFREYVSSALIAPLDTSITYIVSFWLASGINGGYGYGSNNAGVDFSTVPIVQALTNPIPVNPQFELSSIFYDTIWTQFSFQLKPDSAYRYITIGNFRDDGMTQTMQFGSNLNAVYYFLDDVSVTPIVTPAASFRASDTVFCSETLTCVSFSDQSANNPANWKWVFTGGSPSSSSEQNPSNICYYLPGVFPVSLVATNSAGTDSLSILNYITVYPPPQAPLIKHVDTLLYINANPAYVSHQWYEDTTLIPGATDTLLVITHAGNYNVQVTDTNGCSVAVGINIATGLESNFKDGIQLYPVPARDKLFIKSQSAGICTATIYNILGQLVLPSIDINRRSTEVADAFIDISNIPEGLYFLQLRSNTGTELRKFVKE